MHMGQSLTFIAGGLWLTIMTIGSLTMMFSYARVGNLHGVISSTIWFVSVLAILGIFLQWLGV